MNPDDMNLDLMSPFISFHDDTGIVRGESEMDFWDTTLPETLRPTRLQRTVPHHPEIDVFPFPRYRDNLILAGKGIDDVEICLDLLYGVEESDLDLMQISRGNGVDCRETGQGFGGRTGLIVWSDPWLRSSWEVEARKYKSLLVGCRELIDSSNSWRAKRDEGPLLLEESEQEMVDGVWDFSGASHPGEQEDIVSPVSEKINGDRFWLNE